MLKRVALLRICDLVWISIEQSGTHPKSSGTNVRMDSKSPLIPHGAKQVITMLLKARYHSFQPALTLNPCRCPKEDHQIAWYGHGGFLEGPYVVA